MVMSNSIRVNEITKSYGNTEALRGVSFEVSQGEIFGIIGADGAGKSTIFKILATLILPDSGSVEIFGVNALTEYKKVRSMVGYMPGRFSLYQDLSVEENIRFFATLFGTTLEENYDLVQDIYSQLEPFRKRKAGALSGGMKQKLALSCALIHRPKFLLLDEPTTGVDAVSRSDFWNMLKRLKDSGMPIVVSTPYMDEASLCDRIALIRKGLFMGVDTPDNFIQKFDKILLSVSGSRMYDLLTDLRKAPQVESAFAFGASNHVVLKGNDEREIEELREFLKKEGHHSFSLSKIKASIEDCYMLLEKFA